MSLHDEPPGVIIVPELDDVTAPYWEGARRGALLLQRCATCSAVWHPPLPSCPRCRGADVDWFPAGGSGTVESCTVIHQAAHRAFADRVPYAVVGVRLPEGPLVVTNLVDRGLTTGGALRLAYATDRRRHRRHRRVHGDRRRRRAPAVHRGATNPIGTGALNGRGGSTTRRGRARARRCRAGTSATRRR